MVVAQSSLTQSKSSSSKVSFVPLVRAEAFVADWMDLGWLVQQRRLPVIRVPTVAYFYCTYYYCTDTQFIYHRTSLRDYCSS
jgi:hypothetical protein